MPCAPTLSLPSSPLSTGGEGTGGEVTNEKTGRPFRLLPVVSLRARPGLRPATRTLSRVPCVIFRRPEVAGRSSQSSWNQPSRDPMWTLAVLKPPKPRKTSDLAPQVNPQNGRHNQFPPCGEMAGPAEAGAPGKTGKLSRCYGMATGSSPCLPPIIGTGTGGPCLAQSDPSFRFRW